MNDLMLELLRLESADLDAIMKMPSTLPMRLGRQIAGRVRVDQAGDRFLLDLGSEAKQHFIARRFVLPEHLEKSFCLQCPKCEEWRKRLFLNDVSFGPLSRTFTHSLQCKTCIALSASKKKNVGNHAEGTRWRSALPKRAGASEPAGCNRSAGLVRQVRMKSRMCLLCRLRGTGEHSR